VPTVIERLTSSVSTGGLQQELGAQVGALQQAITLAGPLLEGKTPDITALIGSLGALRGPGFDAEGGFGDVLGRAASLIPADIGSVVAPIGGRFAEMATLVDEQLKPLLTDAVHAAQGIQQLLQVRLGCLEGVEGAPPPAPEPPPDSPAPPGRVAVAAQQLVELESAMSILPTSVDAGSVLETLLTLLGSKPRDRFFSINIPVLDDLMDPLRTLADWGSLDAAGVTAHVVGSVEALATRVGDAAASPLADLATALDASAPGWQSAALGAASDALATALSDLDGALQNGTESGELAALAEALVDYDTLRATLAAGVLVNAPALRERVAHAPRALLDELGHLASMLEPSNVMARFTDLIPPFQPVPEDVIETARTAIQPLIDGVREIVDLLDLGGVQSEIASVAAAASQIAADIESGLTSVAVEVQSAFAGVNEAIGGIGLEQLRAQLSAQIAQFGEQIERDISRAFEPAREGTHAAIEAVSSALDAFDPAVVLDALQEVVDGIAGVLNGPEVKGAIDAIREAIGAVVEALKSLSFAPVTDEVVALIGTMKSGLQSIIDKDLNDATKSALGAAMSVLPGDLHPVTDPLLEEFGDLVASGPVAVLSQVKDVPKRLLDEVKRFNPAALIGDQLSAPYRALLDQADGFEAAQLFEAAEAELSRARQRLIDAARPSRALEPLRAPIDELFGKLDAFSPSALLDPLTSKVEETVAQIIEASPVDEVLGAINGVFDAVRDVLSFVERIRSIANRIAELFAAFSDSEAQLNAWRDALLAKVPASTDPLLAPALAGLNDALDGTRHASVLGAFDAATAGVRAQLDALNPAARLNAIVVAYGRLSSRVAALPESSSRTAAQQLLDQFNPMQPLHSAPLRLAGDLRSAITGARAELVALEDEWTETVDGLVALGAAPAGALRDQLAAAIEPALSPVRFLFSSLGNLAAPVNGVVAVLVDLVTTLTERVEALVDGPGSLSAISGAVQQVVDALRNIDLGFVGRSLDGVLQEVRDQLRALDPTSLGEDLDAAFEEALSALSLATIIPPADLAALDAAWQSVIDKLRALDPGELLEDVVQPIYDEAVVPLIEAFDLTPVFSALLEFLDSLEGELGSGLDEVNTAYQSLIALRPGGGSASLGV